MAAAQALAQALNAKEVAPPPLKLKIYRSDDPGQPGRYVRRTAVSLTVHQWVFGGGDQLRYEEETMAPTVVDASSGLVVGWLPNEIERSCSLTVAVANAADHLATVRGLIGGSYAVALSASVPSIQLVTDPLFDVGDGVTFAFHGPLGGGLPTDDHLYALRVADGGSDFQQPVAQADMPQIAITQQQLRTLLSRPADMVLLNLVRTPQPNS
jgi:hypothetical protein